MDVGDGHSVINGAATSTWWTFGKKEVKEKGNSPLEKGIEPEVVKKAGQGREKAIAEDHELGEKGQQGAARKDSSGAPQNQEGTGDPTAATGRAASDEGGAHEETDCYNMAAGNQLFDIDGSNGEKAAKGRRKSSVEGRKMAWNCFSLGRRKTNQM